MRIAVAGGSGVVGIDVMSSGHHRGKLLQERLVAVPVSMPGAVDGAQRSGPLPPPVDGPHGTVTFVQWLAETPASH